MKNNGTSKVLIVLILTIVIGGIAVLLSFIEPDQIEINSYDAIITLNESGDMNVTETWDMNYQGDYQVRFRDIDYKKFPKNYPLYKDDNNDAQFDETSVHIKVIKDGVDVSDKVRYGYSFLNNYDELGEPVRCEPERTSCESLFVDFMKDGDLEGHIIFEYQYTILGALTKYSDIAELNWKLFDYNEANIDKATVTIELPENSYDMNDLSLFYHGLHDAEIEKLSNTTLRLEVLGLKDDDSLEFRMLAPDDLFNNILARNTFIHEKMNLASLLDYEEELALDYERQLEVEKYLNYGLIPLGILMFILGITAYILFDKELPTRDVNKYLSDLPSDDTPAEIGYLFRFKRTTDEDIVATLLDLIRKGYVKADFLGEYTSINTTKVTLSRVENTNQSLLLPHEAHLLNWFFSGIGNGSTVTTTEISNYGVGSYEKANTFSREATEFIKRVREQAEKKNYFETNKTKGRKLVNLLSLIPLLYGVVTIVLSIITHARIAIPIIVSIVIFIIYFLYVTTIKRRTHEGHELYLKWSAFKDYLENFEGIKSFTIPDVETWEHYLIYAVTFKIATKVMDQMKVKISTMNLGPAHMFDNYYFYGNLSNSLNHSFSSGRSNVSKTISAHNASSSSGGGGGGGRSR